MKVVLKVLACAAIVIFTTKLLPGFTVDSFYIALIVSVLLGFFNVTLKPILTLLTLPLNIVTLGLFSLVINAGVILFIASFVQGFAIEGLMTAIMSSLIISIGNSAIGIIVK